MNRHYLLPATIIATSEPMEISTILGSCVAVALFDRARKVCGLCHYLLSHFEDSPGPIVRYGNQAIPLLIDEMIALGANPSALVAQVYGGANILGNVSIGFGVSKKNISVAHELLDSLQIKIVKEDTGGILGRKLLLSTDTFEIQQTFMETKSQPNTRFAKQSLRALIIDPVLRTNKSFENIITQSGITIARTVADSFDAFSAIKSDQPDIIILRLYNQSQSELQLFKDLKKMTTLPPLYIFSLGGTGLMATEALALGASDFVHGDASLDLEALKYLAAFLAEKIWQHSPIKKIG